MKKEELKIKWTLKFYRELKDLLLWLLITFEIFSHVEHVAKMFPNPYFYEEDKHYFLKQKFYYVFTNQSLFIYRVKYAIPIFVGKLPEKNRFILQICVVWSIFELCNKASC